MTGATLAGRPADGCAGPILTRSTAWAPRTCWPCWRSWSRWPPPCSRTYRQSRCGSRCRSSGPGMPGKRRPRRGRRPYPRLPEDAVGLTVRFLGPQPALASVEFRAQEWRLIALSRWLPVPGGLPDPRDRVKWEPVRIGGTVWLVVRSHVVTGPPRDVTLIADCVGLDGLRWTVLLRYQATGKEE